MVSSVNEQSSLHTSLSPSASRVILSKSNVAVIPATTHVFASSFSTLISASPKISPTSSSKELGIFSSVGKLFPTTDHKKQKTSAPPTTNAPRTKEPSKEKVTTDTPETDEPKIKEPTTEEIKTGVYSNYLVLLLFTSMFFFSALILFDFLFLVVIIIIIIIIITTIIFIIVWIVFHFYLFVFQFFSCYISGSFLLWSFILLSWVIYCLLDLFRKSICYKLNFVNTMCIKIFYLMSELIVELRVKTEWNDQLKEKSSAAFKKLSQEFGEEVRSCAFIEMSSITPIYSCTGWLMYLFIDWCNHFLVCVYIVSIYLSVYFLINSSIYFRSRSYILRTTTLSP